MCGSSKQPLVNKKTQNKCSCRTIRLQAVQHLTMHSGAQPAFKAILYIMAAKQPTRIEHTNLM